MPKILMSGNLRQAEDDLQRLIAPLAEIVYLTSNTREEFYEELKSGGAYADIVGIYRDNGSGKKIGNYDAELISKLPSSVKWIAHKGAGYDKIDASACHNRGITVSHTPGAVNEATALTALYLIISSCRQFARAEKSLIAGSFKAGLPPAHDPSAMTLGILGLGGIGLRTAEMAHALPMKSVVYYARKGPVANAPPWAEYCATMEAFLARIDVLSIHVPLTSETVGLVGESEIRQLRKGSIIVNTARGKVLNEDALIRALQDGHLFAAGLDVFADEPRVNPAFLALPNVTLLPHVGTNTQESHHAMEVRALENLAAFLKGGMGRDIVPECRA